MSLPTFDEFFSLKDFAHAALWKTGDPPWAPLHHLKNYFHSQRLGVIQAPIAPTVHLERPELISIGANTLIEPGVFIQGPCIIGNNCAIRHGAYIRAHTILGEGCVIGHSTEIKHSILLNGVAATHFVYIGDSIIGAFANLGAGVKCANLRLDRKEVRIRHDAGAISTGLKKLGAILGDQTQIGCNAVLNPGTLIGKRSVCHPLTLLSGTIPSHSEVRAIHTIDIQPLAKHLLEQLGKLGKIPTAH